MYPIENTKLRVCANILRQNRNKKVMRECRIILLEHILPTTESLIYLLADSGAEIHSIIAKPYSIDMEVNERLKTHCFEILNFSYEDMEHTDVLSNILDDAIGKSKRDGKKLLIFEVGGYFAKPLSKLDKTKISHFAGVVEDTTFGHNRYNLITKNILIPIVSVARSRLKEMSVTKIEH